MDTSITPAETTPLLGDPSQGNTAVFLPFLSEGLAAARTRQIADVNLTEQCTQTFPSVGARTAFEMLILLQWRLDVQNKSEKSKDIWEHRENMAVSSHDVQALENHIDTLWHYFAREYRTEQDIQDVLWLRFPLHSNSTRTLRGM